MAGADRAAEVYGPPVALVPTRTTIEVVGPMHQAAFPSVCVRCGEAAQAKLPVAKLFLRTHSDSPSYYVFDSLQAPVCQSCLDDHHRLLPPIAAPIRNRLLGLWVIRILPYLFPLGVCLFFLKELTPKFLKSSGHLGFDGERLLNAALWLAPVAFFALLTMMFVNMILTAGRQLIYNGNGSTHDRYIQIERGPLGSTFVVPIDPTPIQRSVNFTDDHSQLFDQERRSFTFENRTVAEQFAALNAHRTWNPNSPQARRNERLRWVVIAAFVVFAIVMMIFGKH